MVGRNLPSTAGPLLDPAFNPIILSPMPSEGLKFNELPTKIEFLDSLVVVVGLGPELPAENTKLILSKTDSVPALASLAPISKSLSLEEYPDPAALTRQLIFITWQLLLEAFNIMFGIGSPFPNAPMRLPGATPCPKANPCGSVSPVEAFPAAIPAT